MGRGKIEIKRIENSTNRQVTFSKRRNGIIKKAREISVLCEAQVSVVIFSSSGKMSEYCSPSTSLPKILERYQVNCGKKIWDPKHEHLSAEIDRIKKENDNMQIQLRHLKGEDLNSLQPKELIPIEEALENGIRGVREKQNDFLRMLKKNERILEEDNKRLTYILTERERKERKEGEMEEERRKEEKRRKGEKKKEKRKKELSLAPVPNFLHYAEVLVKEGRELIQARIFS